MKMALKYGPQDISEIEADIEGSPAEVVEQAAASEESENKSE